MDSWDIGRSQEASETGDGGIAMGGSEARRPGSPATATGYLQIAGCPGGGATATSPDSGAGVSSPGRLLPRGYGQSSNHQGTYANYECSPIDH